MNKRYLVFFMLLAIIMTTAALVQAKGNRNFRAHLASRNEVPTNDSQAQGQAIFQFSKDGDSLHYKLIVANIEDVFAAHIHCAPAGQNGPVGVTLFSGSTVTVNGILAEATINAPNGGNACAWTDIEAVQDALESGNTYVNVHTTANPGGEIRGQIH